MRVLLVTGMLAEQLVRRHIEELNDVDVIVLPVSVAAFITPELAANELKLHPPDGYDIILLPGTVDGDVSPVEEATGITTYKGPYHPSEIPHMLEMVDKMEFSKTVSASELLHISLIDHAEEEIQETEKLWRQNLDESQIFTIGTGSREIPLGGYFPMRVIAEIVNAPTMPVESVIRRAQYYENEGAHIIDIGMMAGKPVPEKASELVKAVRSSVGVPVSIDTLHPGEIKAAVDADVDLVLSVDAGNLESVCKYLIDTPVVVLPGNLREGYFPSSAEERVNGLLSNMELASDLGLRKLIADPVLEPALNPGLLESLRAYQLFRIIDGSTPVLFGQGNVTELIDADSPGVNGLLAAMAAELNSNLLFIPEHSDKARRSVRETVTASKMMFLARRRDSPPKDVGFNLLQLKEKRFNERPYFPEVEATAKVLEATDDEFVLDKAGWFVIRVDREKEQICAVHYTAPKITDYVVKGTSAGEIYKTIIREGLVGRMDHAAYLGKELTKAEIALKLGRSYTQDDPLF